MTHIRLSMARYIMLIETLVAEQPHTMAIKASPTLANQETVSLLFEKISEENETKQTVLAKIVLGTEFIARILVNFIFYLFFALIYRKKTLMTKNVIRTWLVPKSIRSRCIVDDYFRDEFLASLESKLVERPAEIYIPLGITIDLIKFRRLRSENQYTVFDFLNMRDVVTLFYMYLMNGRVKKFCFLPDKDLKSFYRAVYDSAQVDFFKLRSFQFFVENVVANKILQGKENFFYVFENQAYEQAWLEVAELHQVKTFGF